MTNQDWIDLFRSIPEVEHGKTVIVLINGNEISVDALIRFEEAYLVVRGRVGGTVEEARGMVVPFHQIVYIRIERVVKIEEMESFFGPANFSITATKENDSSSAKTATSQSAALPTDPAAASRLLLDKLRANRTAQQAKQ